ARDGGEEALEESPGQERKQVAARPAVELGDAALEVAEPSLLDRRGDGTLRPGRADEHREQRGDPPAEPEREAPATRVRRDPEEEVDQNEGGGGRRGQAPEVAQVELPGIAEDLADGHRPAGNPSATVSARGRRSRRRERGSRH